MVSCHDIQSNKYKCNFIDASKGKHPYGSEIDVPINYADYYFLATDA